MSRHDPVSHLAVLLAHRAADPSLPADLRELLALTSQHLHAPHRPVDTRGLPEIAGIPTEDELAAMRERICELEHAGVPIEQWAQLLADHQRLADLVRG